MSDADELRVLVREVIRDVLPQGLAVTETVNLSTDDDLAAFVQRLLDLPPDEREELRSGRKRFRLPGTSSALPVPSVPAGAPDGAERAGESNGGTDEVQAAASAVLGELGATVRDARRPEILASKIITMLDPQQAFLVNRNKIGSMALAGESLFVLEMQPASYAILAANEAEKAARVKLVDYRMIGATGRLYLSGTESDVRQAAEAAEDALRDVS